MGTNSTEHRGIFWGLFAFSLIMIAVAGYQLAGRIAEYNQVEDLPVFAFIPIISTDFEFAGRPVTLKEETIDDRPVVRVNFGDKELVLDVTIPPAVPLPSLYERQKDWMTLNFFADRSGMTKDEFMAKIESDEMKPRLGLVTRTPFGIEPAKAPRFDSIAQEKNASSADVHREQWRFDCYEFNRDGTITHEVKRFPESGRSLLTRQNYAKLKGEEIPQRSEGELEEYSWEYDSALKVMPRAPAITMEKQALRNAGWTLPTAAAGFLLAIVSFFFAIAPARPSD
ncbi:MAG: hypothetical protein ACWA5W_02885 [Phycisphaerales bacterium]